MRQTVVLLAALFLLVQAETGGARTRLPDTQAFDREVTQSAQLLRLPGLSVAVVRDGAVIHRLRYGFADLEDKRPVSDDDIFWLASLTKTFSAIMLMQYQQEGRLSLDDPLIRFPFTSVGFLPQRLDPGTRLKHVLSHTSESIPGTAFVYHGGRYNFVYGVFQQISGLKFPEAYHRELTARIVQPLALEATLAGYPSANQGSVRARIVTPYAFDPADREFRVNRDALNPGPAFPASGLLSSIKDLVTYTTALDEDRLLTRSSYETMCSPFVCNDASPARYGFGWFTTEFNGVALHWAYGLGDSDSSILLRVPSRKLSLIVLSNSSFATAPSRLGGGNPLTSPFIVAFLKHFVFADECDAAEVDYDRDVGRIRKALTESPTERPDPVRMAELLSQAMTRSFAESTFGSPAGQGQALTQLLFDLDRDVFTKNDPAIFHLLSLHTGRALDEAAGLAEESYRAAGRLHPWILFAIAKRYESKGDVANAMRCFRTLVDTDGFEEQGDKIEACLALARIHANRGELEHAGRYLWRALIYTRQVGGNEARVLEQLEELNRDAAPAK